MLVRFLQNLWRAPLPRRAVKSLEFGMIAMVVSVACLGALRTNWHAAAAKGSAVASVAQAVQLASFQR